MGQAVIPDIEGLVVRRLPILRDERGAVLHMLRADSPLFRQFGEIYFSVVKHGAVKAWKRHKLMVQNVAVPVGKIRLVIYDDRNFSSTRGNIREILTGVDDYCLVRIPAMVWYGFQGLAEGESLIANCSSLPHDPAESERLDPSAPLIPFTW